MLKLLHASHRLATVVDKVTRETTFEDRKEDYMFRVAILPSGSTLETAGAYL